MRALAEREVFPWQSYGKKLSETIRFPKNLGKLSDGGFSDRVLVFGEKCDVEDGYEIKLYVLFDKEDQLIADAKFQVYGPSLLTGILESLCDLLIRKNLYQAKKISAEHIEKEIMKGSDQLLPQESADFFNLALMVLDQALDSLPKDFSPNLTRETPISSDEIEKKNLYPDFVNLSKKEKLKVVQEVIDTDIAPYVALDEGGVEAVDINNLEVVLKYSGACTSCYSAIGSTLSAIEKTLKDQIFPEISVVPDLESLNL